MKKPENLSINRDYFFSEGIRFFCQQCGHCCTGDPGLIRVTEKEINLIAQFLKIEIQQFMNQYIRPIESGFTICEDDKGSCLFYQKGCTIYSARPEQCKTFPFWFKNIRSSEQWKKISQICPGIGSGHLYPQNKILSYVETTLYMRSL